MTLSRNESAAATPSVRLFAGYADKNATLYRRMRVALGDPAAWVETGDTTIAVVRDLEMDRVRRHSDADIVCCPADHAPDAGLDADRETATAQATATLLSGRGVASVTVDRTLPFIYAAHLTAAGIGVTYDDAMGVVDRRIKSDDEIRAMEVAQGTTERVMRSLCERIATADVGDDGSLIFAGEPLTSDGVRSMAAVEFLKLGYSMGHGAIVATAPEVADCHHPGAGVLRSGVPVIVDLFPRDDASRYWGDCTRTVVHGDPSDTVLRMHAAVVAAKAACTAELVAGRTADHAHAASHRTLVRHGFESHRGELTSEPSIQHGTGHGIGLDLHEPILIDVGGGKMFAKEVFTVEPGLYGSAVGGVRVEDMIVVGDGEGGDNPPRNLNRLAEGLDWRP